MRVAGRVVSALSIAGAALLQMTTNAVAQSASKADAPAQADPAPPVVEATPSSTAPAATVLPISPPSDQFTLEACIKASMNNSIMLQRQSIELDKARTDVNVAKLDLGPDYSSNLQVRGKYDWGPAATAGSNSDERFHSGLGIEYPIYDSGVRKTKVDIARMDLADTEYDGAGERNVAATDAAKSFFDVLQDQRLLDVANRHLQETDVNLKNVSEMLQAGTVTKGDLLAAQSALSQAQAAVSERTYDLADARTTLALLMGFSRDVSSLVVAEPPVVAVQPPSGDFANQALAMSPHYQLLLTKETIANEQFRLIREQEGPSISLTGGVGYADLEDPFDSSVNTSGPYSYVGFVATLPVFQTAFNRAKEHDQKDAIALSNLEVTQFKTTFVADVKLLQQNLAVTQDAIDAATDAVTSSGEATRLAQERYRVGKATQYEVLTALDQLDTARDQLVIAQGTRDTLAIAIRVDLQDSTILPPTPLLAPKAGDDGK